MKLNRLWVCLIFLVFGCPVVYAVQQQEKNPQEQLFTFGQERPNKITEKHVYEYYLEIKAETNPYKQIARANQILKRYPNSLYAPYLTGLVVSSISSIFQNDIKRENIVEACKVMNEVESLTDYCIKLNHLVYFSEFAINIAKKTNQVYEKEKTINYINQAIDLLLYTNCVETNNPDLLRQRLNQLREELKQGLEVLLQY